MAEILGAVASGLGVAEFALTVGESMSKLRRLWKDVQEAPETIAALKSEISQLEKILLDLDNGPGPTVLPPAGPVPLLNDQPTTPITAHCREALRDLQAMIDDVSGEINSVKRRKRHLSKFKIVLKKGDIEKFQARLDKALDLLQPALMSLLMKEFGSHSKQLEVVSSQMVYLT